MTELFNFSEFYQKSPIPISQNDLLAIQNDEKYCKSFESLTHWLIALEGCELAPSPLQWRVAIYPSNSIGSFNYRLPFFRSPFISTFNEALEYLREVELKARQDQLMTLQNS